MNRGFAETLQQAREVGLELQEYFNRESGTASIRVSGHPPPENKRAISVICKIVLKLRPHIWVSAAYLTRSFGHRTG